MMIVNKGTERREGFPRHKLQRSMCSRKMIAVLRQKVGEKIKRKSLRAASSSDLSCEGLKKKRLSELSEVWVS